MEHSLMAGNPVGADLSALGLLHLFSGCSTKYERRETMPMVGYSAALEQFHPTDLLRWCQEAEQAGFGGAMAADHFHPWVPHQGQSSFSKAASLSRPTWMSTASTSRVSSTWASTRYTSTTSVATRANGSVPTENPSSPP